MAKKGYTAEQIINKLRETEILLSQGEAIAAISNQNSHDGGRKTAAIVAGKIISAVMIRILSKSLFPQTDCCLSCSLVKPYRRSLD